MINTTQLILELKKLNLTLKVHNGELKVLGPKDKLSSEIVSEIRAKKEELIILLQGSASAKQGQVATASKKNYYSASSGQKRMYIVQELDENSKAYNVSSKFRLRVYPESNKLEKAIESLIWRHESLRTSFKIIDEELVQEISPQPVLNIQYYYGKTGDFHDIWTQFIKPFNLTESSLFRVGIAKIDKCFWLFLDWHHIIADGISKDIIINDLLSLYANKPLQEIKLQYKDYSEWENEFKKGDIYKKQELFWLNEFKNHIPILDLPTDFPRPINKSYEGENIYFILDEFQTNELRRIAKEENTTLFILLLTIYYVFLSKICNQEDIVIGTQLAGRKNIDFIGTVGMFVNTLALRNAPERRKTFLDFLKEVTQNCFKSFDNQDYKFEDLTEKLIKERDASRNPIFDTAFNFLNYSYNKSDQNLEKTEDFGDEQTSLFDLELLGFEGQTKLYLHFQYCTKLFRKETIKQFVKYFSNVVNTIIVNKKIQIAEIEIIPEEEKCDIINAAKKTYTSQFIPITTAIDSIAENHFDKKAITCEDVSITYRELRVHSDQVASFLINKGICQNDIVAILGERNESAIIIILGIIKAGATYLPIDSKYPKDRIEAILSHSKANTIIINSVEAPLQFQSDYIKTIISVREIKDHFVGSKSKISICSSNPAYLIYTSGSTGKPKGVLISHKNLSGYNYAISEAIGLKADDIYLHTASFSFSSSIRQLFVPLTKGASLVLATEKYINDPEKLFQYIKDKHVTIIDIVPSYLSNCIEVLSLEGDVSRENLLKNKLRLILTASEPLSNELITQWNLKIKQKTPVINMYGLTEVTGIACTHSVPDKVETNKSNIVSIGKPISSKYVYILDNDLNIVPKGVPGQIYIGGNDIGIGYFNNEEETNDKFIKDPYLPEGRLFKTGDLARYMPNGDIEYIGRTDWQVKIRGRRIETGEIESKLLLHPNVKKCLVTVCSEDDYDLTLVAYIVPYNINISTREYRFYLSNILPEYMIPSYYLYINNIPLTNSGKINRSQLPKPTKNMDGDIIAPESIIQIQLANIWADILNINKELVGIDSNFFELGGHSLKAIILSNKICKEFNTKIPLDSIFMNPTIDKISKIIEKGDHADFTLAIKKAKVKDFYHTTYSQKRLWILHQKNPSSNAYQLSKKIWINHPIDVDTIRQALSEIIRRHESFRTGFTVRNGEIMQFVSDILEDPMKYFDITLDSNQSIEDIIKRELEIPYDLNIPPLCRFVLIRYEKDRFLWIYNLHHIITDGWSMEILRDEFTLIFKAYNQQREVRLEPLEIQYKEYAEWQFKLLLDEKVIKKAAEYYIRTFSQNLSKIILPFDFKPTVNDLSGAEFTVYIEEVTLNRLISLARSRKTTLSTIIFTVFNITLSRISNQEDFFCTMLSAGRINESLSKVIGYFINNLVIRINIKRSESFANTLSSLSYRIIESMEYQHVPFEFMCDYLRISPPELTVAYNMLNMQDKTKKIERHNLTSIHQRIGLDVRFDLLLYAVEYKNCIELEFQYKTSLFKPETIEYVMYKLMDYIKFFAESPDAILEAMDHSTTEPRRSFKKGS